MNPLSAAVWLVPLASLAVGDEIAFKRHVIDAEFRAEAVTAADVNRDGPLDIIAGENWYSGPDWRPHKFRDVPMDGGYRDVRLDHPFDVNGDGWVDLITVRRAGWMGWLENPRGENEHWKAHQIGESADTESVVVADLNADGVPDLIGPADGGVEALAWWHVGADRGATWVREIIHPIPKARWRHGIGAGDVNRDGRLDVLSTLGWYDPKTRTDAGHWTFHPLDRGDTHHPVVYDFDGDGDQDVAAGAPHDYGLSWWEQRPGDSGPEWVPHLIDRSISQLHALVAADMDGDGDADLVTGKRYKAHDKGDPGLDEPALLAWWELQRDGKQARFVRHVIDEDSGVGYMVTPVDIDRDGDRDVLTSNKKGLFLFEQAGRPAWLELFNGKDLSNWSGDMSLWSVRDGSIVGRTEKGLKHNSFLVSRAKYGDFVLTLEVKLEPDTANSGIQFRSTPRDDGECAGYQADIGRGWWGSIYEELGRGLLNDGYKGRGERAVIKGGWNRYVVYAVGDELRVEINGTVCTHLRDDKLRTGVIGFQIHSGGPTDVRFRNIRMRGIGGE
ncbi:MAG: hypothetical protein AMXMBFR13_14070 [Phycisphaerae bacterium]